MGTDWINGEDTEVVQREYRVYTWVGWAQAQNCQRKSLKDHIFLLFKHLLFLQSSTEQLTRLANIAFHTRYLQFILYHTNSKVVLDYKQ